MSPRDDGPDGPHVEAARMIVRAGRHLPAAAHLRLEEFQKDYAARNRHISSWVDDLAWAWTDEEWGVVLMAMTLGSADNDRV